MNWNENTVSVYKKCRQRLHFLSKLSKCEVNQNELSTFYQYQAEVQSFLLYCFLCYHSSLSTENMNKLECVVKQAAKSIHVTPLRSLHSHYVTKKTENILGDATHPLHTTFIPDGIFHFCTHCPLQQIFCTICHQGPELMIAKSQRGMCELYTYSLSRSPCHSF